MCHSRANSICLIGQCPTITRNFLPFGWSLGARLSHRYLSLLLTAYLSDSDPNAEPTHFYTKFREPCPRPFSKPSKLAATHPTFFHHFFQRRASRPTRVSLWTNMAEQLILKGTLEGHVSLSPIQPIHHMYSVHPLNRAMPGRSVCWRARARISRVGTGMEKREN